MKVLELRARGLPRRDLLQARESIGAFDFSHERAVTVDAERMAVRESVRRELGARDQDG
jgi:hypothetical protein